MTDSKPRKRAAAAKPAADKKQPVAKAARRKTAAKTPPGPPQVVLRPAAANAASIRGRIPTLAPERADDLRRLFGEPHVWELGDGAGLRVGPATVNGGGGETCLVDADGSALALRLQTTPAHGELQWSDYQGRARLLAWSVAHERPLRQLSDALGVALLPLEAPAPDDAAALTWLDIAIDDGESATHGALGLPPGWVERLAARATPPYENDPLPDARRWLDLPQALTIGFSGPRLDAAAWLALRPGDVVVVGRDRALDCRAHACDRSWPLAASTQGWRIDGPPHTLPFPQESSAMNQSDSVVDDDNPDGNDDHPARSLPVQLDFELGRLELSVGELAALQPGYVFALPANLEGANVAVRANGRSVGRGELVAVGDTLGVRLLSWT